MNYLSVAEAAKKWNLSERSVRNYCAQGRVPDAFLTGKTWNIPETAEKPVRLNAQEKKPITLLDFLINEKQSGEKGGIYHKIKIELTYNSNHMEGSRLSHEQTRYIYETNTIGFDSGGINVDDILETVNHFRCIDLIIDTAHLPVSEKLIKQLHSILKTGTEDSRKDWFAVGDYKKLPNEVGGKETTAPEDVPARMKQLLSEYNATKSKSLEEILDFHYKFESIHPFQDGNGRVGRLIMFKECLRNDIVPFIIEDDMKMFYYRGLANWETEKGYLTDTCLSAQNRFKVYLDYFRIADETAEKAIPHTAIAYTDGSYNPENGMWGYGACLYAGEEEYELSGKGEDIYNGRQIQGETTAALAVCEKAISLGIRELEIRYDYEGVRHWAMGTWKANKPYTKDYAMKMQDYRQKMQISFTHVKAHTGVEGNEKVDKLAKTACGILKN